MHTRTELTDDLDGSTDTVTEHRFSLDGATYEIDLSAANLAQLRAAVAPFIAAARLQPTRVTAGRASARTPRAGRGDGTAIRAWWAANHSRGDLPAHRVRGAIPQSVRRAYAAEQPTTRPAGER